MMDLYLDGLLDEPARVEMEQRISRDAGLRAAQQTQARIDASLRRMFAPPAERPSQWTDGRARPAGRLMPPPALWRRPVWLVAACLLMAASIGVYFLGPRLFTHSTGVQEVAVRGMIEVHEELLAGGYVPEWRCEVGPRFAMYVHWRLGQTLLLAQIPPQLDVLGWAYCNSLSPETMVLLVRVDGAPVSVFIDRRENDRPQPLPPGMGLHLHRREIHDLVAYELSQQPQPQVLALLYEPEIQEGWKDIPVYEDLPQPQDARDGE